MNRIRPDVDVVLGILQSVLEAQPGSTFVRSLLQQYQERGGLSKKQLEGLHSIASKKSIIPATRLATLEAIIKKKPTRYKSERPAATPLYTKDEAAGDLMRSILARYPEHKRVLFLLAKYENNETLSPADLAELQRFGKLLG